VLGDARKEMLQFPTPSSTTDTLEKLNYANIHAAQGGKVEEK